MRFDRARKAALLVVVTAGLSACSSMGTTVADDDPETEVPNSSMGRAIMEGLGAVPSRQQGIKYTPRAPLVMPPSKTALVAPEDPNRVASLNDWPDDPDAVTARRLAAADQREKGRDANQQTPASELMAVRLPNRQQTAPAYDMDKMGKPLMRHEFEGMKKTGDIDTSGVYDANGVPHRRALVEPPVGYLQPAPGADVTTKEPEAPQKPFFKRLIFW